MKQIFFVSIFMLTMFSTMLHAQEDDFDLLISAYFSQPNGDYYEKIGEDARATRRYGFYIGDEVGLAKQGFGLGVELFTPVILDGLGWVFDIRYLSNETDAVIAETHFSELLGENANLVYTTGTWINIPIMTGFRYKLHLLPNFVPSVLLQAGINLTKAPTRNASRNGVTGEDTSFRFTRDFGYEVGLGVDLFRKFNIGLTYLYLNTPRYEGTRNLSENVFPEIFSRENQIIGESRSISMFLVNVGYYIF